MSATTIYIALCDYEKYGLAFAETALADSTRDGCIRMLADGAYAGKVQRIIECDPVNHWSADVSREIATELAAMIEAGEAMPPEDVFDFCRKHGANVRYPRDDREYEYDPALPAGPAWEP